MEIIGPPEIRSDEPVRMFAIDQKGSAYAALRRGDNHAPELEPAVTDDKRFLLSLFLRRYVTWCARTRRFAAMQGAAHLYREVLRLATMSAPSR